MISSGVWLVSVLGLFAALCGTTEATCGGVLNMERGSFQSPNFPKAYPSHSNCIWRITVPDNYLVALTFTAFQLEQSANCADDYLEIRDEKKMIVLGHYCGTQRPNDIFSSGNTMTVKFVSDGGTELQGFVIDFRKVTCGGDVIMDQGSLQSPNYPVNYPSYADCMWRITVPENNRVSLSFKVFNTQTHENCAKDYLEIRDGHDEKSTLLGLYCGVLYPQEAIVTSSNKMAVKFVSDRAGSGKGFVVDFRKEKRSQNETGNGELLACAGDDGPFVYIGDNNNSSSAKYKEPLKNLTQFFMNIRQSGHFTNKCGHHLTRTAMALYLADQKLFHPTNRIGQEITYEISLQLVSRLSLKQRIGTHELALYVNALLVSCLDPRNFFGINVVAELRKRADSSNYTNPFTILTLCNVGDDMTMNDVRKVQSAFDARHRHPWTDTQAFATMAMACLSGRPNLAVDEAELDRMITDMKRKQHRNGTVDNLASTALVVQALHATDSFQKEFYINRAMTFITQKIMNESLSTLESFYILPVLSGKSLVNISDAHCPVKERNVLDILKDLRKNQDDRIQVQYSVYVGTELDYIRSWKIKVPSNYTFYDVLEKMAALEPEYRVQYSVHEGKPYVRALTKIVDHAEKGMFWFVYKQTLGSNEEPKLVEASPADLRVNKNEELILWYRSGTWAPDRQLAQ